MQQIEIKMPGTIQPRGNSVGITIPAEIAKAMNLEPGTAIDFQMGPFKGGLALLIVPIREEPQP